MGEGARQLRDFAILEDLNPAAVKHLENHESLTALTFTTEGKAGTKDFTGFGRWLEAIHHATNPAASLRDLISTKRILWMDPSADNNAYGLRVLRSEMGGADFTLVTSVEEVVALTGPHPPDLIITRWGHRANGADALRLLAQRPASPVVVFASGDHRHENREAALRRGAMAYTDTWSELFEVIDERFGDRRCRSVPR